MMNRIQTHILLASGAMALALSLSAAAMAQTDKKAPPPPPPTETQAPKGAPAPATKPPEKPLDKPAAKPADKPADDKAKAADKDKKSDKDKVMDAGDNEKRSTALKMNMEEERYRARKAKIARLREIATEQKDTARLKELDRLEAKTEKLHDEKMAKLRAKLPPDDAKKVEEHVSKGRTATKSRGNSPDVPPGLEKKGVTEHPGKGRDKDPGANDDKGKDKSKDKDDKEKDKDKPKDKDDKGKGKDKDKDKN